MVLECCLEVLCESSCKYKKMNNTKGLRVKRLAKLREGLKEMTMYKKSMIN